MQLFHFIVPFISLLHVCLADYTPTPTRTPSPTRPFTVAAFLSPFPSGANGSISGVTMRAQGGSFWLNPLNAIPSTGCGDSHGKGRNCPPGNETVLWVDKHGEAWLDSTNPQQVYLDTQTGILSYLSPSSLPTAYAFSPGAVVSNFLHLGQGTAVSVPFPGPESTFANVGPGTFQWLGSDNPGWFACPRPGPGYQVMKDVGGFENWNACRSGLQLVALDYEGASPASGVYL